MNHSLALRGALFVGALATPAMSQVILPSDGLRGDFFGYSVDLKNGVGIVGAPFHDAQGLSSGSAYVFELSNGPFAWQERSKLLPPDNSEGGCFGISSAIDGDFAAVGAPGINAVGGGQGQVYVFRNAGNWGLEATLTGAPGSDRDRFGEAVDLDGKWLAVGAPRDDDMGTDSGAVYLYRRNGNGWVLRDKLTAPSTGPGDSFGFALDLDGNRLAVGAYQSDLGTTNAGAVHVFLRSGGSWNPEVTLLHPDPDLNDHLGRSVDLSDKWLVAGCPEDDDMAPQAGAAMVWVRQGTSWSLSGELRASDGAGGDSFGHSVSVANDGRVLVSAPNDDDFGYSSGGVYLFEEVGTTWTELQKHPFGEPTAGDYMGLDLVYDGEYGLAGAMFDDTLDLDAGAVMGLEADVFDTQWYTPGCFCDSGPCGNDDPSAGCVNSLGFGTSMSVFGSNSVSTDDLVLQAAPVVPGEPGYLLMGSNYASPVGMRDGLRCVDGGGGSIYAYSLIGSDSSGTFEYGPGLAGASSGFGSGGTILSGSTWTFQVWYRDNAGPCGQGSNLSNSVQVTFAP